MNGLVLSWDADNAGRNIGQSILDDNLHSLAHYSQAIKNGNELIVQWAQSHGGEVISDGGDQGVVVFHHTSDINAIMSELEHVRAEYQQIVGNSVTFGVGGSLSESGKSLIAGKLMGKDMIVQYDEQVEHVLQNAHEHAQAGEGTEDEQKQDEHYISHLMGDEDDDIQGEGHEEGLDTFDLDQDPAAEGIADTLATDMGNEDQMQSQINDAIQDPESQDEEMSSEDGYDLTNVPEEEPYEPEPQAHEAPGEEADEMSMPMQDDGMQEQLPEMSDDMPMQEEPMSEDQGEGTPDFQEEEGIEVKLPEEAKKDEENVADPESQAMAEMAIEDSQLDQAKEKVAQVLQAFKAKKDVLEQLKNTDPEAYQAMIEMLKAMIEMAQIMAPASPPEDSPAPQPEAEEMGEEALLPKQ